MLSGTVSRHSVSVLAVVKGVSFDVVAVVAEGVSEKGRFWCLLRWQATYSPLTVIISLAISLTRKLQVFMKETDILKKGKLYLLI